MQDKKAILVAVMGTTPAILTETIWALAHKEQTLPDEVVVIATKTGRRKLEEELLSGGNPVWLRLRKALEDEGLPVAGKLRFGETSIRVIPDARGDGIADLRTKEENLGAADFMLRQLRQYTEDPGTVVLTSIAGGRKTMSALMFSCMTLLGRPDDKVYHVLLPSPFEGGVSPAFYFPEKGAVYTAKDGKKYSAADVDGELFEVPYVRMRELYREKYRANPPGYQALVAQVQASVWPARQNASVVRHLGEDFSEGSWRQFEHSHDRAPFFPLADASLYDEPQDASEEMAILGLCPSPCKGNGVPLDPADCRE